MPVHSKFHVGDVFGTTNGSGEDAGLPQIVLGRLAEGLLLLGDHAAAKFAAKVKIPLLGNVSRPVEILFPGRTPKALAANARSALPVLAIPSAVDLQPPIEHYMRRHTPPLDVSTMCPALIL
ncbi:MAG: hypothetical protein Q7T69_05155 [Rhodoferax sp.]|nr:hypothetical protein [Rhodoferax sp.]